MPLLYLSQVPWAGLGLGGGVACSGGRDGTMKPGLSQRRHRRRAQSRGPVTRPRPERGTLCGGFIPQGLLLPHTLRPGCSAESSYAGRAEIS